MNNKNFGDIIPYAETNLPTEFGSFRVVVFREIDNDKEHLAIIKGDIENTTDLLVRVHSECFTAEVLHSLKCDCKEQLHEALRAIGQAGRGMIVYLRQEGRGIGLGNKIRAYSLQESGFDTVDANRALGFEDDSRTYEMAAGMLRYFKVLSIRLLTNNPEKIEHLENLGIEITRRESILCEPNPHNIDYFVTKKERMRHMFSASFLKVD